MSVPLLTPASQPVAHNTFSYGGDDAPLGSTGFFGTIAVWDKNARDDCFKASIVFFVKKAFAFLDFIGIGTCAFGYGGFAGKLEECEMYLSGPERNQMAREKIVEALGGRNQCLTIPVVNLYAADFNDYLHLGDAYFRQGQWAVQGEDPAGRKFVLLRLADRSGNIATATIHQRYRETCVNPLSLGGSLWTCNIFKTGGLRGVSSSVAPGTNEAANTVSQLIQRRHQEFTIAPR